LHSKTQPLAGNCLQTFVGHTAEVSSANFSPDGKQIVSASWDKSLKLWDLAGNCLQTFVPTKVCRQLPAKSQSLRLLFTEAETICLPSGLKFALKNSAAYPTKVRRQLPAKSQSLRLLSHVQTFVGHTAVVSSANFSPDGKQIVSASWDKSLKLWDLAGNCLQTFD
jgi:WD40 repeat protein